MERVRGTAADTPPASGVPGRLHPVSRPGGLTRREWEIAQLIAAGLTDKQVGEQLFISPRTANVHMAHIFAKLEMKSRVRVARWVEQQLANPQPEPKPHRYTADVEMVREIVAQWFLRTLPAERPAAFLHLMEHLLADEARRESTKEQ